MVEVDGAAWGELVEGDADVGVLEVGQQHPLHVVPVEVKQRGEEKEDEEDGVVEGKDAQAAAGIELAEVARVAERVVKDAGDEEAGEDEEKINAMCAKGGGSVKGLAPGAGRCSEEEVGGDNADDSEATQPIECGEMFGVWPGLGGSMRRVYGHSGIRCDSVEKRGDIP